MVLGWKGRRVRRRWRVIAVYQFGLFDSLSLENSFDYATLLFTQMAQIRQINVHIQWRRCWHGFTIYRLCLLMILLLRIRIKTRTVRIVIRSVRIRGLRSRLCVIALMYRVEATRWRRLQSLMLLCMLWLWLLLLLLTGAIALFIEIIVLTLHQLPHAATTTN